MNSHDGQAARLIWQWSRMQRQYDEIITKTGRCTVKEDRLAEYGKLGRVSIQLNDAEKAMHAFAKGMGEVERDPLE